MTFNKYIMFTFAYIFKSYNMMISSKDSTREEEWSTQSDKSRVTNIQETRTGIGKSELAQELYPGMTIKSALNALRKMINSNPDLLEKLRKAFYNSNYHTLTYWQASIIRNYFYGPQYEYK